MSQLWSQFSLVQCLNPLLSLKAGVLSEMCATDVAFIVL